MKDPALHLKPRSGLIVTLGIVVMLGACSTFDTLASKFEKVAVGDSRASVVQTMGTPEHSNTLEVPMVRLDTMAWKSALSGKVYLVLIALDRVVAKTAIQ